MNLQLGPFATFVNGFPGIILSTRWSEPNEPSPALSLRVFQGHPKDEVNEKPARDQP
jgi:hypothetical protein